MNRPLPAFGHPLPALRGEGRERGGQCGSGPNACGKTKGGRLMAPMRDSGFVEALHEPPPHPVPLPQWGRGWPGGRVRGRFMVPMRAQKRKEAFHEPAVGVRTAMSARIKSEALADKAVRAPVRRWFMVPVRDSEIVEATHEPPLSRPAATLSPPCGERAGRGVPIWFMAPMRVQILEVPPTHEPGGARLRRALIFAPMRSQSVFKSLHSIPTRNSRARGPCH